MLMSGLRLSDLNKKKLLTYLLMCCARSTRFDNVKQGLPFQVNAVD